MTEPQPLRLAILGAGGRGRDAYGRWAVARPDRVRVVAVADRSPVRAEGLATEAGGARQYPDWRDLINDLPGLALDAAIVALPDSEHVEPAMALMRHGVPMLLEKPAASRPEELQRLAEAADELAGNVAVGHVLRFTPFWQTVRELVNTGMVGRLMTIELSENIGFWHFAHSYVRGNWKRAATSSPMVLAKTCHDLDLVRWLAEEPPAQVFSTGSLSYFRPENAPSGAPEFCIDGCPAASSCPFYAPRYYVDALRDVHGVPVSLLTSDTTPEGRLAALAESDYGRCVFRSSNDVADHQQTTMTFPSGLTASLTASAFTGENTRRLSLTGTAGQITGHMENGRIDLDLFSPTAELPPLKNGVVIVESTRPPLSHRHVQLHAGPETSTPGDHRGHAGGDDGLMEAFVSSLESRRWPAELSLSVALDSHHMAFAAEKSRLSGEVVDFTRWPSHTTNPHPR
jgi:predicted dehydrogenase